MLFYRELHDVRQVQVLQGDRGQHGGGEDEGDDENFQSIVRCLKDFSSP